MPLDPAHLSTLSRLLDEGMDLPAEAVERWLSELSAGENASLVPRLREMLADRTGAAGFMAKGPVLGKADGSVAFAGQLVGPYRLIREIGRGGMGTVWLAERADGTLKRLIALKLPRLAWGAGLEERMARERDIGALLEHPNIARLYDAGVDAQGRPYLALEYVDGQPIDTWCKAQDLSVRARLKLIVQVAHAVSYAHGRLIVHRDLKPSNVLVTPDGQTHLLDFGIAKLLHDAAPGEIGLTEDHGRVLTPHFASPEQIRGEAITVQSDVYSLGVLTYELLTNNTPYELKRKTLGALEEAILEGEPPLASSRAFDKATAKALHGEIDAILAKALRREHDQRYATADAFANDIERYLSGERVLAQPDSTWYRMRKVLWRHRLSFTAAAAVLVAVVAGSAVALLQAHKASQATARERLVKQFVTDVFRVDSKASSHSSPSGSPGPPKLLLENGAGLIQQRFAGQPDLQAELYGIVSGMFSDMGAYKLAVDYSTRQIEALADVGADRPDQVTAILALAQAQFDDDRLSDAESNVRKAMVLSSDHSRPQAEAWALLSRVLLEQGRDNDAATALSSLQSQVDAFGSGPSVLRGWLMFQRGRILANGNHLDEAVPLFLRGIDLADQSEGPLCSSAIRMRLDAAYQLVPTSQTELTETLFGAAVSGLNQLGGVHSARAALEAGKFAFMKRVAFSTGSAAEADAVLQRSRATLTSMDVPLPDWFIPQIDFWRGIVKIAEFDVDGALPLLQSNVDLVYRARNAPKDRFWLTAAMGWLYMNSGKHELAEHWLREHMETRSPLAKLRPYAVIDHVFLARNFMMQGNYEGAHGVIARAPPFGQIRGEGGPNADRYARQLVWTEAEIFLAEGNADRALTLLQRTAPMPEEYEDDRQDFNGLLGEALCTAGDRAQGLEVLAEVLPAEERSGYEIPASPRFARQRAILGLCALATGDRKTASLSAARARSALNTEPHASPYFFLPLAELERRLKL